MDNKKNTEHLGSKNKDRQNTFMITDFYRKEETCEKLW